MKSLFNVVFDGEVAPGKEIGSVKMALRDHFRLGPDAVEKIFSGRPIVMKKNVDARTAAKLKKAFEAVGALCHVEPASNSEERTDQNKMEGFTSGLKAPEGGHNRPATLRNRAPGGDNMIVTNIEAVPGKRIVEHFGLVSGSTIRAKHIGRDFMASLKNLVGGEIKSYTKLLQESRNQALERMVEQARQLGANAVINVRFSTSSVAQGAAELYAYGTAIRVE